MSFLTAVFDWFFSFLPSESASDDERSQYELVTTHYNDDGSVDFTEVESDFLAADRHGW